MARELVLASTSPYRRALLSRLGVGFQVARPDCDETPLAGESADRLVARLAEGKARSLEARFPDALLIGSDQVAVLDDRILGKPGSASRAVEQLSLCSGRQVVFLTAICLHDARTKRTRTAVVPFSVFFRRLSHAQVESYVARERPLDAAGSFKSEGLGIALFERMQGDDPSALVGLPLIRLCAMLAEAGVDVLLEGAGTAANQIE